MQTGPAETNTIPTLTGFDHIHVEVTSWTEAERWYQRVLGFRRVEKLMVWAVEGGPLTLEDPGGTVHLALFESRDPAPISAVAFGSTGEEFLEWKRHLERHSLELRVSDHDVAWSMYFHDPFGNVHEITTYDHAHVAAQLA